MPRGAFEYAISKRELAQRAREESREWFLRKGLLEKLLRMGNMFAFWRRKRRHLL